NGVFSQRSQPYSITRVVFWMLLRNSPGDDVHIRLRLRQSDARLQTRESAQVTRGTFVLIVRLGHRSVEFAARIHKAFRKRLKIDGQDADNCVRSAAQIDLLPDNVLVTRETPLP